MKQVIIVRSDLGMGRGKIAAQACHASIGSYKKTDPDKIREWEMEGSKKVVLSVPGLEELMEIYEAVRRTDISHYLCVMQAIPDNGRNSNMSGIGPDTDERMTG